MTTEVIDTFATAYVDRFLHLLQVDEKYWRICRVAIDTFANALTRL